MASRRISFSSRAFTLMELLIVVAIIIILVLIALPNFLESQRRARTARVRAEHRSLATALEAYHADTNAYPSAEINGTMKWIRWISTPIAYIARVDMEDPFTGPASLRTISSIRTYRYYGFNECGYLNSDADNGELIEVYPSLPSDLRVKAYVLFSHGPDKVRSKTDDDKTFIQQDILWNADRMIELVYDPTNGSVSNGEIFYAGGEPQGKPEGALKLLQQKNF